MIRPPNERWSAEAERGTSAIPKETRTPTTYKLSCFIHTSIPLLLLGREANFLYTKRDMQVQKYLPSPQFMLMFFALALSGALVFVADYATKPKAVPAIVADAASPKTPNANWEATLYDIQAQQGVGSLPEPPDPNTVDALRQAAQTSNITESVGRTLLINLANAKGQGLGDDIPTQTQLVNEAAKQLKLQPKTTYALSDLTVVPSSPTTVHSYANALMLVLAKNSKNNVNQTLYAAATATDKGTNTELKKLSAVEANYRALVKDLVALPVPQTYTPFHLGIVNDFAHIADTYPDIEALISDPLRGLVGLQKYQALGDEIDRMFINIAQTLNKDGILFSSTDPGRGWAVLTR